MKERKFVIVTGACMFLLLMMILFNFGGGSRITYSVGTCPEGSSVASNNDNKCCPNGYSYYLAASGDFPAGCYNITEAGRSQFTSYSDGHCKSNNYAAALQDKQCYGGAGSDVQEAEEEWDVRGCVGGTPDPNKVQLNVGCLSCNSGYRMSSHEDGRGPVNDCIKCADDEVSEGGKVTECTKCEDDEEPSTDGSKCVKKQTESVTSCDPGYYLKDGKCERCTQNFYCTGGTAQPVACGTETVQGELLTSKEDCENNTIGSCMDCISSTGDRLIREWFAKVDSRPTEGSACGNSQGTWKFYAPALKSNCNTHGIAECPAGQYSKSGNCVTCPAGYYCTGGKTDKKKCDNGYSSNEGAKSKDQCNVIMTLCEANQYYDVDSNSCKSCPMDAIGSTTSATSPAGSTSVTDCKCASGFRINPNTKTCIIDCAPGKYANGTTCTTCPAGYYCPGNRTELDGRRYECPQNSTSPAGSDTIDDCKCNSGYSWNDKTSKCEKGSSGSSSSSSSKSSGTYQPSYDPTPQPSSSSYSNQTPPDNPQTGNIMLFVVWIIGFAGIGYAFWYFKNLDKNGA